MNRIEHPEYKINSAASAAKKCLIDDVRIYNQALSAEEFEELARQATSETNYILVEHLRREYLADTELAKAEVNTIRLKLFKIGARVVWSVRRIVFHLASGYPLKELFMHIVIRLKQSFNPPIVFR